MIEEPKTCYYYVDEAGDLTLFDRRGRTVVGVGGVSRTFVVGAALIDAPETVSVALDDLRAQLLRDRYFAGVPSMQPAAGKTARQFHAKDDLPEVRREVFRLLASVPTSVFVGIRRKSVLAEEFRAHYARTGYKLGADAVYDRLVVDLFMNRLHQTDENHIVFARRGKADRNIALRQAIATAKWRFEQKWRKGIDRPTVISSSTPSETKCLQVIDYYLWALQRLLERGEDRFFSVLADRYRLIVDHDDTRLAGYGAYYSAGKNPLTLEKLMPVS